MKVWQIASVGFIACILGCGGAGAYVPDEQSTGGTPLQCAVLSLSLPGSMEVPQGGTNTESFSIINGNVEALQSRAAGDATVTFSISGLPNNVTATFDPSSVTVPLDSLRNIDIDFDAAAIQGGTAYNLTITATQSGCTPVSGTVPFSVYNEGS